MSSTRPLIYTGWTRSLKDFIKEYLIFSLGVRKHKSSSVPRVEYTLMSFTLFGVILNPHWEQEKAALDQFIADFSIQTHFYSWVRGKE